MGLVGTALAIVGFIKLWRTRELRFLAVAVTVVVIYVLAWVPGKVYYTDGVAAAVLAAGSVAAERWIACARRPRLLRDTVLAVILVTTAVILLADLPIVPVGDVHAADLKPAQRRCREHRRLAAARPRSGRTGRGPLPDRPAADIDLHRVVRGSGRTERPGLGRPPAARALRPQRLLDVGAGTPP